MLLWGGEMAVGQLPKGRKDGEGLWMPRNRTGGGYHPIQKGGGVEKK